MGSLPSKQNFLVSLQSTSLGGFSELVPTADELLLLLPHLLLLLELPSKLYIENNIKTYRNLINVLLGALYKSFTEENCIITRSS